MDIADLLVDAFDRVRETVLGAVEGLTEEQLGARLDPEANSIAWLVWHLTRVQDDHVCDVAGVEQAYTAQGWAKRFGLPFDDAAIGYGQRSADVAAVRVADPALLVGYYEDVHAADPAVRPRAHRRGSGPRGRRGVGPAGDARRPAGVGRRRRPPARGPGGLRARDPVRR